jgi:hypothetical protein
MMKGNSGPILNPSGGGMADYGTEGAPRRPHTAHGGRGVGFPSSSQQVAGGVAGGAYGADPNKGQALYDGEEVGICTICASMRCSSGLWC